MAGPRKRIRPREPNIAQTGIAKGAGQGATNLGAKGRTSLQMPLPGSVSARYDAGIPWNPQPSTSPSNHFGPHVGAENHREANENTKRPVSSELDGDDCTICKDTIEESADLQILHCGHKFHPKCLCLWTNSGNASCKTCPLCFKPIDEYSIEQWFCWLGSELSDIPFEHIWNGMGIMYDMALFVRGIAIKRDPFALVFLFDIIGFFFLDRQLHNIIKDDYFLAHQMHCHFRPTYPSTPWDWLFVGAILLSTQMPEGRERFALRTAASTRFFKDTIIAPQFID